jgi:hypothetical protein
MFSVRYSYERVRNELIHVLRTEGIPMKGFVLLQYPLTDFDLNLQLR